jgi:phosphoacetylglucosamine mutase
MITASHNPEADNGVKLVEPSGEMLVPDWEVHATQLAQAATDDELVALVTSLAAATAPGAGSTAALNDISTDTASAGAAGTAAAGRPKVIIGRDTRPSGEGLAAACKAGVQAVGVQDLDVGVVTTPELHFCVQTYNQYHTIEEAAYFTNILESYRSLTSGTAPAQQPIHVECANGVGALKLQQMVPQLQQLGLNLVLYNTGHGRLNHMCGADYVQKEQTYPAGGVVQPSHVCARLTVSTVPCACLPSKHARLPVCTLLL